MRDVELRALAGPLPAAAAGTSRPPARLRDLVQRRRGQHNLLRDACPRTRSGRGPRRPSRTSGWSSSCRRRSPMSAASPTSPTRCAPSWPRSSPSGRVPMPSGYSCRRRSARPTWARSAVSCAVCRASYRYAVEVRHRAFFADPRWEQQLESVLGAAGAEWVPFDTTVLFGSPPVSDIEREAWRNKPRVPRRTRALTSHPIVRYIGRDDPARTAAGWQDWADVGRRLAARGAVPDRIHPHAG